MESFYNSSYNNALYTYRGWNKLNPQLKARSPHHLKTNHTPSLSLKTLMVALLVPRLVRTVASPVVKDEALQAPLQTVLHLLRQVCLPHQVARMILALSPARTVAVVLVTTLTSSPA